MPSEVVLLFAGQGSRTTFSEEAAKALLEKVSQNDFAIQALSACYDAFVQDHSTLSEEEKHMFTDADLTLYTSAQDLVRPSSTLHENPIAQATTLYIHQILEYVFYAASGDDETTNPHVAETAGFCSGILPAIAVAASPLVESSQFLSHVVAAFRVVFWTAIRSAMYSKSIGGSQWKDTPWSLVVAGISRPELEAFLGEYRFTVSDICFTSSPSLLGYCFVYKMFHASFQYQALGVANLELYVDTHINRMHATSIYLRY
jgi:malonyl CoA-acyl carrier protein transacylase